MKLSFTEIDRAYEINDGDSLKHIGETVIKQRDAAIKQVVELTAAVAVKDAALRFYATGWDENAMDDLSEPHLAMMLPPEPTEELMLDYGFTAKAALATAPATALERVRDALLAVSTHYSASLDYQPPYVKLCRAALALLGAATVAAEAGA